MTKIDSNPVTLREILGTTRVGCDTLVIASDWWGDRGDHLLYGFAFDRDTLKKLEPNFDVYFKRTSKGFRITKPGKKVLRGSGRLVQNGFTYASLYAYRLPGENQSGNAYERYSGEVCSWYEDKILKRDVKMTAYFTPGRLSTRYVQCKLMYTGTVANV